LHIVPSGLPLQTNVRKRPMSNHRVGRARTGLSINLIKQLRAHRPPYWMEGGRSAIPPLRRSKKSPLPAPSPPVEPARTSVCAAQHLGSISENIQRQKLPFESDGRMPILPNVNPTSHRECPPSRRIAADPRARRKCHRRD